jgi:hypothetical protein
MRPGPIDVGQIASRLPSAPPEELADGPQSPPKVNGTHANRNGAPADAHLSVAERLAQNRQRRQRGQQGAEQQQGAPQGQGQEARAIGGMAGVTVVPLDFTLDLIYELTHNQRQYRPDKDTGGVNLTILHLPHVIDTAIERIQAKVPVRCGRSSISTACIEWGLKGLGQYAPVQRLLYLKSVFREREETGGSYESEAHLAKSRSGRSLYGIRGQILHQIFKSFEMDFAEDNREGVYLPRDTYDDLSEVLHYGLGLELQSGAVLAIMYTLVDVASCETTKDVTVEDDRVEMRLALDRFLDHVQVRAEAAEFMMRGWGMLETGK